MSLAQETVNKLLDFNQKLDIGLLDTVVGTLYSGTGEQQKMAQEVLTTLKEHPDAWTKVKMPKRFSLNVADFIC
jgi:exportin-1